MKPVKLGKKSVGPGEPVYITAEIGINHNGDLDIAKKLIAVAAEAGCDAVKFQKRNPDVCVPKEEAGIPRETPWGTMTYLEYKHRIEFGEDEYAGIDSFCKDRGIDWFASCWDIDSVDFMERFAPPCHKIASATLADDPLVRRIAETGRSVVLSTGMSTMERIKHAVSLFDRDRLILMQSTSTYPCDPNEVNLNVIPAFARTFDIPIGYSGHELGIQITGAAVAIGACMVERHITLDRHMWGTDQSASIDPGDLSRMVRDIRIIERAMGDGVKRVFESEQASRQRLRRTRH